MRVCLFEDQGVADFEPLALTRPVFDLVCGQSPLGTKQCRCFNPSEVGTLIRPYLAPAFRLQQPVLHTNDLAWLRAETTVLVNGRWLPPQEIWTQELRPCVAVCGDELAFAVLWPEHLVACSPNTIDDCLETWKNTLPTLNAGGKMMHFLWDLVNHNAEQLCLDFQAGSKSAGLQLIRHRPGIVGPENLLAIAPTAQLDPLVVVDTTRGPVVIDRDAVITAFSRIEGPCYIGPSTHVMGAKIRSGTTLGPNCRIGGEVENCIIQGHTNKYHDGFIGHGYVGEWVNLAAGTQSSDLRNDYGEISVPIQGRNVATACNKVGCFLGDHTKTGLGTLLNTGTNAGTFCNLLPSGHLLPKYFPSFTSYWNGTAKENADLPALLTTAREVMRRRGSVFTEIHAALFRHLFDLTAGERCQVTRDGQRRQLRLSA
jgi:UDP-N-acetylglucosamine diphosphorylase/glucosamine-1-phosphate N-acetyltransferase